MVWPALTYFIITRNIVEPGTTIRRRIRAVRECSPKQRYNRKKVMGGFEGDWTMYGIDTYNMSGHIWLSK